MNKESKSELFHANNERSGNWLLSIPAVAAGAGFAASTKLRHSSELILVKSKGRGAAFSADTTCQIANLMPKALLPVSQTPPLRLFISFRPFD